MLLDMDFEEITLPEAQTMNERNPRVHVEAFAVGLRKEMRQE